MMVKAVFRKLITFRYLYSGYFLLFLLTACSSAKKGYNPQKKYGPEQLIEDFDIGWKTYQKNHPSYDWFTPADTVNARFARVRASLTDSLTEPEFRLRLAYALSIIRCGHTSVISSKAYQRYTKNLKEPQFPFSMKVLQKDSLVVTGMPLQDTLPIKRGDIVLAIDGVPASTIIRQMRNYISTDGYSDGFKDMSISANFPGRFKWLYGLSKQYEITYLDSNRVQKSLPIPLYNPEKKPKNDSTKTITYKKENTPAVKPQPSYGNFTIDTLLQTGILTLNNFSHHKVPSLIKKTFRESGNQGLKNLIIDLRSNGGGKIGNSTLLTSYVIDKPFRIADTVWAKDLRLAYPQHTQAAWVYRYFRWVFSKPSSEGGRHNRLTERQVHQPKKRNHYSGQLYVLTSGATFSASTLFLAKVQHQPNVTILGDETGGGARGNTAVFIPKVTLPNTGVQLRLPLFRLVTDATLPHNGQGIMPDISVAVDSYYIQQGKDKKMEMVKKIIQQKTFTLK